MATDELAEINGIKPNIYLADGEEKEVSSMTRFARLCLVFFSGSRNDITQLLCLQGKRSTTRFCTSLYMLYA